MVKFTLLQRPTPWRENKPIELGAFQNNNFFAGGELPRGCRRSQGREGFLGPRMSGGLPVGGALDGLSLDNEFFTF